MSEENAITDEAMAMLKFMALLQRAVEQDDPLAQPYLEVGAVQKFPDGTVGFHKDKFLKVLGEQVEMERLGEIE